MIPSEWFHKLKNMTKLRKKHPPPYTINTTKKNKHSSDSKSLPHASISYFSNKPHTPLESKILQVSPRNSLHMIQSKRKAVYKPSPPSSSSVSSGLNKNKIKFIRNQVSSSASSNSRLSSSADNIIIDMHNRDFQKKLFRETKVFDSAEKACPASNRTAESRKTHHLSVKVNNKDKEEEACRIQKKHKKTLVSTGRRSSANSPRIKLRVTSPRIQVSAQRSRSRSQSKPVIDSFAVIKSSLDPKKDFRESMVEMIAENNIRASKDLKDLLACYLSLNPKEYHDLIIKVFVQVWVEVINSTFSSK